MSKQTDHSENKESRLAPDQAVVVWESSGRERKTAPEPKLKPESESTQPGGVTELDDYRQSKADAAPGEEAFVTTWSIGTATTQREPLKLIMISSGFGKRMPAGPQAGNVSPQAVLCRAA